jgi:hypothetical protein
LIATGSWSRASTASRSPDGARLVEDIALEDPDYLTDFVLQLGDLGDGDREAIEAALRFRNHRR